ncbi:histidinolphosphatase [Orbilia ellipsospora]|uniref:Histidinol-phosphatase n=1 Tax=Orbilia ellipsospora TaxID=2528407 RepID=A0AAV9X4C5_9PEZI
MPFSHHSHSGQFCAHAKDTLEECILAAISKNMRTFALTEHMPRSDPRDLYPEEVEANYTPSFLSSRFAAYYTHALELREKYKDRITLLIGFEVDFIRPSMLAEINQLRENYEFDIFVGSVHHVDEIPIDFSREVYEAAIATSQSLDAGVEDETTFNDGKRVERFQEIEITESKGEERLFEVYFDTQYAMLTALQPPVIGHFDLIRLKSDDYSVDLSTMPKVWEKVVRNVKYIAGYGGMVEINSAATRKGWQYPYPGPDVLRVIKEEGVRVVLSDDSHGTAQVGFGYAKCLEYLEKEGVDEVWYYEWKEAERGVADGVLKMSSEVLPKIGTSNVVARSARIGELKTLVQ